MYLTHFSRVSDVARLGAELLRRIDALVALTEAAPGEGVARKEAIHASLVHYLLADAPPQSRELLEPILSEDMELNAQGLAWWLDHRE
jgi:hydroxyacylglutathione hydrolase